MGMKEKRTMIHPGKVLLTESNSLNGFFMILL